MNKKGKKQVSNPISPGASVPERRPSFTKHVLPNETSAKGSQCGPTNSKTNSIRVEKTIVKPKHEPIPLTEETKEAKDSAVEPRKKAHKANTQTKHRQTGEITRKNTQSEMDKEIKKSTEDLENIIDEIIKNTPNPTVFSEVR